MFDFLYFQRLLKEMLKTRHDFTAFFCFYTLKCVDLVENRINILLVFVFPPNSSHSLHRISPSAQPCPKRTGLSTFADFFQSGGVKNFFGFRNVFLHLDFGKIGKRTTAVHISTAPTTTTILL